MALKYCWYRTARVGDGSPTDGYRSKLCNYIVGDGDGTFFSDIVNYARAVRYALVRCDESLMDTIDADEDITPLSPRFNTDVDAEEWLDSPRCDAFKDAMESDGMNTNWVNNEDTNRQLYRYLRRFHNIIKHVIRNGDSSAMEFFMHNLDRTVANIPPTVRTGFRNWMENIGLDSNWITPSTTVRQVLHYVAENVDWMVPNLGGILRG